MHLHPARVVLHGVVATALAGGALLLTGTPGQAAVGARPDVFGGDATASSLHYMADRRPQPTPVSDAFHAEIPYATTTLNSSGTASATAASLYPGAGPLGAPSLLCQFGAQLCKPPFPAVPRYPFIATASYPTTPDDKADRSFDAQTLGPLLVSPNVTRAHADPSRVEAVTQATGVAVNGVLSAESATTTSKQAFEGSTLVVTAVSTVKGLDLGGGRLHIDALRSVATARVDGGTVSSSSATTTITGATADGTPVRIDSTGIHVAGNGDNAAAQEGLNTALKSLDAAGITVRLLRDTKSAKAGSASAATGGLLITFARAVDLPLPPLPLPPLPGAPPNPDGFYFGSVTVGGAGVTAFAAPAEQFELPDVPLPPVLDPPVQLPPPAGVVGPPPVPGIDPPTEPAPTGTKPTVATPGTRPVAVLGLDLTGERLRLLTLVLLGYPLLVLVGGLRHAPARLPRA